MPRYKVRSEGDRVRVGDQVLLESVKTASQYVHVSPRQYPKELPEADLFEIDLAAEKQRASWTILAHQLRKKGGVDGFLKVRPHRPHERHRERERECVCVCE
jgi:hypothetical protein